MNWKMEHRIAWLDKQSDTVSCWDDEVEERKRRIGWGKEEEEEGAEEEEGIKDEAVKEEQSKTKRGEQEKCFADEFLL